MGKSGSFLPPNSASAIWVAALGCLTLGLAGASNALACDGKNHTFDLAVGASSDAGGLVVRLDKAKLSDDDPDKYYISVKDFDEVLADHMPLHQYDSANFKTKCGTASIGLDRGSVFSHGTMKVSLSYF